jgi:RND family efflux transporter MFP subunit
LLNDGRNAKALDRDLALRKPHLEKAKANLDSAQADLRQAEVNLSRTVIRAPFNSVVLGKNIELGSQVTTQDQLAELVGIDEYWVEVSVPTDRLKWISIPKNSNGSGAGAKIFYRNGSIRSGKVIKLLSDLESEGRMARLLISVKDPLALKKENKEKLQMLIGEYVRVKIEGTQLNEIYTIPRSALRDNVHLWLLGKDNRLHIREVGILWRDADIVVINKGLSPGESVIISDLPAPVEGMPLTAQKPNPGRADQKNNV